MFRSDSESDSSGSSPRMWGDQPILLDCWIISRFIPTHVGRSNFVIPQRRSFTVHPHACGEIFWKLITVADTAGSSPRMWGDPTGEGSYQRHVRFIPTHVGRSLAAGTASWSWSVHPHACGEIFGVITPPYSWIGSSPRMWGDPTIGGKEDLRGRFIPTHVGRSCHLDRGAPRPPVHPHACGEIRNSIFSVRVRVGSSPRMWGDREYSRRWRSVNRFIPTHVGRSPRHFRGGACRPVHPHACGEICISATGLDSIPGSSPRMWGDPVTWTEERRGLRFIPTHVGRSFLADEFNPARSVHPHACGEICRIG
ncbi:MAG: hypothetical protein JWQ98_561 [Chlorobi bacterium]|nr:hypothetical protein [Chlorobiota bacterium]